VSTLVVIPARYASTRLPGKPLHLLNGKPMIQWVWEAAVRAEGVEVLVATEDQRIVDAVWKFGGRAVMTSPDCASGTDRVAEAAAATSAEFIINLQGDEPTFTPESVAIVAQALRRGEGMATLDTPLDAALATDPNIVKVVKDARGYALYFSRSPLPYPRNPFAAYRKHLGIYGYRRDILYRFVELPQTALEKAESLEQLRALENGIPIYVAEAASDSVSVDTAEDAEKVSRILGGW
jgi:3-deoxy-manno-octulosonate cytidylyltransferase (CMP-KDO synthetase)